MRRNALIEGSSQLVCRIDRFINTNILLRVYTSRQFFIMLIWLIGRITTAD